MSRSAQRNVNIYESSATAALAKYSVSRVYDEISLPMVIKSKIQEILLPRLSKWCCDVSGGKEMLFG